MKLLRQFILTGGIAVLVMLAQPLFAQPSNVTSAWNYLRYKEYTKARDAINKAIVNEKTMNDAKTWLYRAQAYRGISEDEKMAATEPNAVMEAFKSLKKAVELDASKEHEEELKTEFYALSFGLYNYASSAYNDGEKDNSAYARAYESFLAFQESENLMGEKLKKSVHEELTKNGIDPLQVQQLIGSSAQLSGNTDKAIEYYKKLADAGFKSPGVYVALASLYRDKGDTAAALSTLDKGMSVVTDDVKDILNSKLDIMVKQKKYDEVLALGNKALAINSDTATSVNIYIAMGNAYYEKQMPKEAEEMYSKALAKDPNGFNTNFSLGISLYEQGRVKYNASLEEKSISKAKKLEEEYTALFVRAIPYMEKANKKDPKDREVMQLLAEMYSKTGDYAKAKEYTDKLKQ